MADDSHGKFKKKIRWEFAGQMRKIIYGSRGRAMEWDKLFRYIVIPIAYVFILLLIIHRIEKKNIFQKKWRFVISLLYLFATMVYVVPLWHYDVFSQQNNLFLRSASFKDSIVYGCLGALLHQSFIGLNLLIFNRMQLFFEAKYVLPNNGTSINAILLFTGHLLGAYYMQGILGILKNDFEIYPLYIQLHRYAGLSLFGILIMYVTIVPLIARRRLGNC